MSNNLENPRVPSTWERYEELPPLIDPIRLLPTNLESIGSTSGMRVITAANLESNEVLRSIIDVAL